MPDDMSIGLFTVERLCRPDIDVSQLALTSQVDRSESVYTQKYVKLANASLPSAVLVDDDDGAEMFDWDLFLILKYSQKWTPNGYGLGELLFTISLMPDEELTLEVKTWETSKSQQDREDAIEQRNVSDIKDSSSASSDVSETREKTTNTSVNGKASYSGFGFSASIEGAWSENVRDLQTQSAKETRERSQQATNEYRASHKVRMAVSREQGSESKTTRKIRNINQAHTMNVNYYEVLTNFDVELSLAGAPLALLGPEVDLSARVVVNASALAREPDVMARPAGELPPRSASGIVIRDLDLRAIGEWTENPPPPAPPPSPDALTLGQLIRYSQSRDWVTLFINENGFSPVKLLYELWSEPLQSGAVPLGDVSGSGATITDGDRARFRDTMLQFVRPVDGWIASDERGRLRWGYEIVIGQERAFLEFFYPLLPNSARELRSRAVSAGFSHAAATALVIDHFARATERVGPPRGTRVAGARRMMREPPGVELPRPAEPVIASDGPFKGKSIERFESELPAWISGIESRLQEVRATSNPIESWRSTLPTQGVYSDLTLGICSGAEDYLEIQRQFDLERRKLENERLKLQIEKLRLENQRLQSGEPSLIIGSDADETNVSVNISAQGEAPGGVQVKSPGP